MLQAAQLLSQAASHAAAAGSPPAAQLQGTPGPLSFMLAQGLVIQGPIHQPPPASQGQQPQMDPSAELVLLLQAQIHQDQTDAKIYIKFLSRMTVRTICLANYIFSVWVVERGGRSLSCGSDGACSGMLRAVL
jgi:hypothetical protein